MKKYILFAAIGLAFSACKQKELDESNHAKDSLNAVVSERETALNEFIAAFNDVERNLDSVAVRQHIITVNADKPGELKPDQKTKINNEIAAINELMERNQKQLAELNKKLKSSGHKNAQLEKTIVTLNEQLNQKNIELTTLNEKLSNLNAQVVQLQTSVVELTADNAVKSQTISEETAALNTAYYAVGKSKDLQEAKLIDRKGGLLGIGKTSKLSSNFDNSKFTKIDITQIKTIPVNGEDIKIVTAHPSDSYTLDKDPKKKDLVRNLIISNPEKFWSSSKHLVIVKD